MENENLTCMNCNGYIESFNQYYCCKECQDEGTQIKQGE